MLDFPNAPTVGQKFPQPPVANQPVYTWDGEKWTTIAGAVGGKTPVYTDGSTPMAAQLTLVNPPVAATDAAAKAYVDNNARLARQRNYVINGAMMVSQENGATAGSLGVGAYYPADQFFINMSTGGTISAANVPSPTPGGSPNRCRVTVTAADAAVAAADFCYIGTRIEGINAADLRFGFASAKTVTLQFGCKGPAGTYCIVLQNGASNRNYVAEYTIAAGEANTDVLKSVTIAGDKLGTWLVNNGIGIEIRWSLMAGSTYQQAANAWTTTNSMGSSNQFNLMGTAGNVFELFDVGLYEGLFAPPFQVPDYASELTRCKRYWRAFIPEGAGIAAGGGGDVYFTIRHDGMRASPSSSSTAPVTVSNVVNANYTQSQIYAAIFQNGPDWGHYQFGFFSGVIAGQAQTFRAGGYMTLNARM